VLTANKERDSSPPAFAGAEAGRENQAREKGNLPFSRSTAGKSGPQKEHSCLA